MKKIILIGFLLLSAVVGVEVAPESRTVKLRWGALAGAARHQVQVEKSK